MVIFIFSTAVVMSWAGCTASEHFLNHDEVTSARLWRGRGFFYFFLYFSHLKFSLRNAVTNNSSDTKAVM